MILNVCDTSFSSYIDLVNSFSKTEKKIYVETFGCQQNEADSEKILGIAKLMNYSSAEAPEDADMIILNTCAIRRHAEEKALSMIGRFKSLKKKNSDLIVGVCGCMAAEKGMMELLKKDFHYVSFTLEPNMLHRLPELIYNSMVNNKRTFVFGDDIGDITEGVPMVRSNGCKAWVSVMYGCNNFCSYCIVPYVRGRERSRSADEIINECIGLVQGGYKEITLLGQNVNSYQGSCDFPALLERISAIDGDFIIRFMTSHPKDVSDRLIEVMRDNYPKIAPYFHLPLQSGSDSILKHMNRTYTRDRFLDIVSRLRAAIPNICISTDVIVGFPGETEDDFADTMDVLERVGFDMVYAFKYSPREGTPAAGMTDQIDMATADARISSLLALQDKISIEKNKAYVGRVERVLVDSSSRRGYNTLNARTVTNKLVHFEGDASYVGQFKYVKIKKAEAYDLLADEIIMDSGDKK